MSDDLVKRSDSFRLGASPTPDDVNEANWLIDRMSARIEELEAKLRNSALQEISALGQASEAYQAQLKAEAKLAQQDDLVQAAVAAALREAVAAVKKDADNDDISQGAAQWVSDTILALIPQGAQAALDRVVAAERERCAKVAERNAGAGSHAIAARIRKGGE